MSPAAILGDALSFGFAGSARVLDEVSFEVRSGEAVALLGDNGAGKSTLLHLCLGYLSPAAGRLRVLGEDPSAATDALRAAVAYVPETARLYPTMSGRQLIDFFGKLTGQRPSDDERDRALIRVGFPLAALDRATATYSKGMRQKIVLGLGLLKRARLFLLDEPTTGLDPQSRHDLATALRTLSAGGAGVFFTTHDNELTAAAATRCLRLAGGRLANATGVL
jgi:ABC-type multidrug transport system ATPase subunit